MFCHRRPTTALPISSLVAITLGWLGSGAPARAAGATVSVDGTRTTGAFPADAVGLSYEMRTVGEGGFDVTTGNEAAVFSTLGIHNIRIGGNTVDYGTFWQPGGKPVPPWATIIITPADVARVAAFAKSIDAKVAWAVNLQHLDATLIDDEVGTVLGAFGDKLDSIQCGNEPNGIFTGYPAFKTSFDVCKGAIKGRSKISGPDTYGGGGAWNAGFASDEASVLSQVNYHYYTGAKTVAALLAPAAISGALSAIRGSLAAAKSHGLSYRTDETNSEAGGGIHGVSDTFGSALWAMHYALATIESGAGINFHGLLGVCGQPTVNGKNDYYTPICAANPADATAKIMTAGPEYYGLWMAGHLGPGMFQPVTVAGAGNLVAYAVKGADGATRIALIDKEPTGGMVPVTVTLAGAGNGTARVIHLTGPSLAAPAGAQIQGAALDHDGHLAPGAPDPIEYSGGSISLALPTGSAAILTVGSPGEGGGPDGGADGGGDALPGGGADGPAMKDDAAPRTGGPGGTAGGEDAAPVSSDDAEPPPHPPAQSGCGCRTGDAPGGGGLAALLVIAALTGGARRRLRGAQPSRQTPTITKW